MYIAICNVCQEADLACFDELAAGLQTGFDAGTGIEVVAQGIADEVE
jgi:hypothetical protein